MSKSGDKIGFGSLARPRAPIASKRNPAPLKIDGCEEAVGAVHRVAAEVTGADQYDPWAG